jgi:hypothetical protein
VAAVLADGGLDDRPDAGTGYRLADRSRKYNGNGI